MCGIIASSSPDNINRSDFNLAMLMADDRGSHATGFTDGNRIVRVVDDAQGFLQQVNDGSKVSIPDKFNSFIGHTRYATAGKKSLANTHPFNFGNIIGVHNGTIDNFKDLKKEHGDKALKDLKNQYKNKDYIQELKEIESDSMLLFWMINKYGLKDTVKQTKGTMGLVYYDEENNLNVYRYDKPLCYGFKDGELWLGSLKSYLKGLGCSQVKPFTQHCHFTIKNGHIKDAKQLKHDYKPEDKAYKHRDDYDPDFTKEEQKKGRPKSTKTKTTTSTTTRSNKHKASNKNKIIESKNKDSSFNFQAPMNAKGAFVDGGNELILWWFSNKNPDHLYVEVEGHKGIMHYNLGVTQDRTIFEEDFPEIEEEVFEDYMTLETVVDLRQERKNNVTA